VTNGLKSGEPFLFKGESQTIMEGKAIYIRCRDDTKPTTTEEGFEMAAGERIFVLGSR
jgi:hypothetical protein